MSSTRFDTQSKHNMLQYIQEVISMNYKIELLIIKNRAKLEQMIREESDYNKIVKQSQRLDKYLNMKMRELVK